MQRDQPGGDQRNRGSSMGPMGRGGNRGGSSFNRGGSLPRGRGGSRPPRAPATYQDVRIQTAPIVPIENIRITPKEKTELTVNCYTYKLNSLKPVYKYELLFSVTNKMGTTKSLVDRIKVDYEKVLIKNVITVLYDKLLTSHDAVFHLSDNSAIHVYDRMKDYYSSVEIQDGTFEIDPTTLPDNLLAVLHKPARVFATIAFIKAIDPNQVNSVDEKLDIEMYLDCLVTQRQLDSPQFYVFGSNVYDKIAWRQLDALHLIDGHHKINKLMGNDAGLLQLEPKRAAFFPHGSVLHFASQALAFNPSVNLCRAPYPQRLDGLLKGIAVETTYNKFPRRFKIHEVDSIPAEENIIPDKNISVAQYFVTTYNMTLQFPHFPCLVEKRGLTKNYYPIEALKICEGQRASRGSFSKKQNTEMIKQCQQVPAVFLENMKKETAKAEIDNRNSYLQTAGLSINRELLVTEGKILHAPQVQYNASAKDIGFGEWRLDSSDKFVRGGVINQLLFAFSDEVQASVCKNFGDQLIRRGRETGMVINNYRFEPLRAFQFDDIVDYMNKLKDKSQVDFLFIIGDAPGLHDSLKAAEQVTLLNTQQVKPRTIERVGGSTFDNILMKLNLKVGGINQNLGTSASQLKSMEVPCDIQKSVFENTLCMGFQVAHPGSRNGFELSGANNSNEPSVLGYSYTTTSNGNVTSGNYLFIRPRQTILDKDQLERPIYDALEGYKVRRGRFPERIIVFRGSVSDGEFRKLSEYETKKFGEILREFVSKNNVQMPTFTMIVISKRHNFRLLKSKTMINPQDKAPNQNVMPGTLIDHTITTEGYDQFVFVSHKSLQGCGKPVVATVVARKGETISSEVLQQITYNSCLMHEIVPLSISVPAPIRSAEQLANRGQRNLIKMGNGSLSGLSSNDDVQYLNTFYLRLTDTYETKNAHRFWA